MDNWITIPPLKGTEGVQTAAYAPGFSVGPAAPSPTSRLTPTWLSRVCDLMYSSEGTMRNVFGVERHGLDQPPEGELGNQLQAGCLPHAGELGRRYY